MLLCDDNEFSTIESIFEAAHSYLAVPKLFELILESFDQVCVGDRTQMDWDKYILIVHPQKHEYHLLWQTRGSGHLFNIGHRGDLPDKRSCLCMKD